MLLKINENYKAFTFITIYAKVSVLQIFRLHNYGLYRDMSIISMGGLCKLVYD